MRLVLGNRMKELGTIPGGEESLLLNKLYLYVYVV